MDLRTRIGSSGSGLHAREGSSWSIGRKGAWRTCQTADVDLLVLRACRSFARKGREPRGLCTFVAGEDPRAASSTLALMGQQGLTGLSATAASLRPVQCLSDCVLPLLSNRFLV